MKNMAIIVLLVIAGLGGYWLGGRKVGADGTALQSAAAPSGKKILYYRNPMGLPDTSPTPKKDAMGMDYIPVYEGEEEGIEGAVKISPAKVQKLGVRTEAAALRKLSRPIRAVGRVAVDERRVYAIAPKFEGWIERLFVNATGQPVGRGQALFEVYSPELVSAQREYQIAARAVDQHDGAAQSSLRPVAEAALARLRNWDISLEQIERLKAGGEPTRTLIYRSPVAGVVLEKKALQGQRFTPGEALYQIADIGTVWVLADVFERDIAAVRVGMPVTVKIDAWPGREFAGRVGFIYPTLDATTRTVPVRIELTNPRGELRPAMYANVDIKADAGGTTPAGKVGADRTALTVPVSAVIDGGTSQRVIVQLAEGRFEPREVKLGVRSDDYVEVIEGVREGEQVVVAANFLIDSESNLKAALGGMREAKTPVSHQAVGTLDGIEADGTLMISHEPVASLNWPKMTMGFVPAHAALAANLKPGMPIAFEFVERRPGEWVITKIERR
ncbi:efflux RND transporter periplasmic adaptor subunit [Sulfuricystis thermophila]|uniref:efflux RND transporter periplasmic adaptor subunit n=1 Tax=Sulfuricystis thermophila TaxID=2496847 RepID=UPI001035C3A0|nr:efflux RND transporter periplasmic adaptor subunit [Sulfuricystis thermophila]